MDIVELTYKKMWAAERAVNPFATVAVTSDDAGVDGCSWSWNGPP